MVRTKDLVLIVTVLVVLMMAISATVASRMIERSAIESGLRTDTVSVPAYDATVSESGEINRQANIERLRGLLAQGDVIDASPSVEVSPVPEAVEGSTPNCIAPNTGIDIARRWPLTGVDIETVGSLRQVVQTVSVSAVASGTAPMLQKNVLLTLPLTPVKSTEQNCLDSQIIGVTVDGSLMFNADAILYKNTAPGTLVGYARDGFPIYGAYAGERDECGGVDQPTGYRYVVSTTENTFLNCFIGSPQLFR